MDEDNTAPAPRSKWGKRLAYTLVAGGVVALGAFGLWKAGVLGFLGGGEVIVIVNGEGIKKAEYEWQVAGIVKGLRQGEGAVPEETLQAVRSQVLQKMVDQQLIYERGRRLEIEASAEEVEASMEERRGSSDEDTFAAELSAAGISKSSYRASVERELVVSKTISLEMEDVRVSDAEIKQYYEMYKDRFAEAPEEIKAAHVLLMVREGDDEGVVLARIKEIREKALAGEDFGELAARYSEEPGAAERKGSLGFFARGQMVKPFEERAFALKVGEVSAPVKTRFGYHLIKLLDRLPAGKRSFEQASEMLSRSILEQRRRQKFMALLTELRVPADIEYKPGFEPSVPVARQGR